MNHRAFLIPAIGLLLLVVLLWRQSSLEDEIDKLREEIRTFPRVAANPAQTAPAVVHVSDSTDSARLQDTIAELTSRIDELENVASDSAKIINQALEEKEAREAARPKPSWSSAQATGAPDTATGDDRASAWAPAAQDGGEEWLQLTYNEAVEVAQVLVRETHNPGAISKVSVILENGAEVPIWQGAQQAVPGPIDRAFPTPAGLVAHGAKVYLDTKRVPGWNEIDAVALIDRGGTRHWAAKANASSSYGSGSFGGTSYRALLDGGSDLFLNFTQ